MPKQKGSPKTGGRKAGTPNKATSDIREKIKTFLEEKSDCLNEIWENLEPKEQAQMYNQMCRYIIPTMQATEFNLKNESRSTIKETLDELTKEEE